MKSASLTYSDMPERQVELLDAAAKAFTQMGFAAATIDSVADLIGVTKGSVYYYYRSKTDLFFAVHRRAMEINLEAITPLAHATDVSPSQRIWNMAHCHTHLMMEHLNYQRVTVQGLEMHLMGRTNEQQRAQLEELVQLRDNYERLFRTVIEQGIEAGEFPAVKVGLTVKPLLGALNWTTMWYQAREGETADDREVIARHVAQFVTAGLTTNGTSALVIPLTPTVR
jgi:AcrR family transcriptional regulator